MNRRLVAASLGLLAPFGAPPAGAAEPAYQIVDRIAGPDGGWDAVNFDPASRRLYVARTDGIMALEVDAGKVTPHFTAGDRTHQAVPLPGGELVFTNGNTNQAIFVNAKSGAAIATVTTGDKPDAAIWDAHSKLVLVMNHAGGDVTFINPKTHKAVGAVAAGGTLEFAASDGHGHAFVNIEDQAKVAVIDIARRTVSARIDLPGCEEPSGLAYTKGGLVLSACANGVMTVVDAKAGKEIATVPIGQRPDNVIYDGARALAFVPCGGDGTLTIVSVKDPAHVTLIGSIATQKGARTGAVDEKTGRIYLPAAEYNAPAAPDKRPTMKAGTFVLLVVAPKS